MPVQCDAGASVLIIILLLVGIRVREETMMTPEEIAEIAVCRLTGTAPADTRDWSFHCCCTTWNRNAVSKRFPNGVHCTRLPDHTGPHFATGGTDEVLAVWHNEGDDE